MSLVVKILGAFIIVEGLILLLKPEIYPKLIAFFMKGKLIYFAALLKTAIGIVMLISALSCNKPWIVITFGLLVLFGGILMLTSKFEKTRAFLDWWRQLSLTTFRMLGAVALVLGGILLYAA